jgi:hypothetical protein
VDTVTEVRYAGVTVGRAALLRDRGPEGAFLVFAEPLPVGTSIVLKMDEGELPARVAEVVESADPNAAGMRLRFVAATQTVRSEAAATSNVPEPAPPAPDPRASSVEGPSERAPGSAAPSQGSSHDSQPGHDGGHSRRRRRRR